MYCSRGAFRGICGRMHQRAFKPVRYRKIRQQEGDKAALQLSLYIVICYTRTIIPQKNKNATKKSQKVIFFDKILKNMNSFLQKNEVNTRKMKKKQRKKQRKKQSAHPKSFTGTASQKQWTNVQRFRIIKAGFSQTWKIR